MFREMVVSVSPESCVANDNTSQGLCQGNPNNMGNSVPLYELLGRFLTQQEFRELAKQIVRNEEEIITLERKKVVQAQVEIEKDKVITENRYKVKERNQIVRKELVAIGNKVVLEEEKRSRQILRTTVIEDCAIEFEKFSLKGGSKEEELYCISVKHSNQKSMKKIYFDCKIFHSDQYLSAKLSLAGIALLTDDHSFRKLFRQFLAKKLNECEGIELCESSGWNEVAGGLLYCKEGCLTWKHLLSLTK